MANSGFFGFVVDGVEKIGYEHDYSHPKGLGLRMLRWLRDGLADAEALRCKVKALRVVSESEPPTPEDVAALKPWTNLFVGSGTADDWYCLLRETQGDPDAVMAAGVVLDATPFAVGGLWVDWGYIADFDAAQLEVYVGAVRQAHTKGRFAHRCEPDADAGDTYTSALVKSWPLNSLPEPLGFIRALHPARIRPKIRMS